MTTTTQVEFTPRLQDGLSRYLMWQWEQKMQGYFGRRFAEIIKKPQLVFCDSKEYLGRFTDGDIPQIKLSKHLVVDYSWCAVNCVFLHEVAHQIASIVYHEVDILAHGKEFREICHRIGAIPDARIDVVALDEQLSQNNQGNSGIEEKLRKLLTLADRGDENEAQLALAKALEIMSKYGITEEDLNGENEYVTAQVGKPFPRLDLYYHQIVRILTEYWGVYGIFGYQPDLLEPERNLRLITISGPKDKVIIALYVYDYIMNNMILAYERMEHRLHGMNKRRDFFCGYLKGIEDKLRVVASNTQVYALIHKGDAGTKDYVARHFGSLHMTHSSSIHVNESAKKQGFSEGSKLNINPGVSEGGGNRLLKE
ncbi:MAG: DUF2786 domain-containing protein [Victivallales bacterium]|nr:DUF2786 domain-containing protein [Victivallales bacterium]